MAITEISKPKQVEWVNGHIPEVKAFLDKEMRKIHPELYPDNFDKVAEQAQFDLYDPLLIPAIVECATTPDVNADYEARFILSKLLPELDTRFDCGRLDDVVENLKLAFYEGRKFERHNAASAPREDSASTDAHA